MKERNIQGKDVTTRLLLICLSLICVFGKADLVLSDKHFLLLFIKYESVAMNYF